ncbi:MAG TPA: neutral zinc metallopeptidase, partial [Burkholderiaceae bacterium]|nr:neutral zinc metallopeptidase [Burkholderiaceae bacterium]
MRWEGERESGNVEDRRGSGGGGGFGLPIGRGGIGVGTIVIALIIGWVLGINPLTLLGVLGGGGDVGVPVEQAQPRQGQPADDRGSQFVRGVLGSTGDVWGKVFQ